jgi:acetylornithine aminotransferase
MSRQDQLLQASQAVIIENYGRLPLAMVSGEGATIRDADGREYLDFFPGFGAGGVGGHCHPAISGAVKAQADTLLSHGNLFTNPPQVDLAERITRHGFGGKVFYCQSGAEANESALKLVRLAARGGERKAHGPYKVISFNNCFHGRTMGALSITPAGFQAGFEPMLPGSLQVDFGDLSAVADAIDEQTAGIFVEAIQVEGGVNVGSVEFVQGLRKLCDEHNLLLVVDEVWTAPGRTGQWFAHQHYDIQPDVMTLGKAIGGGLPVGVMVAAEKWADVLGPGTHGSTMGGNPLCAAAGAAAMKLIEDENLLQRSIDLGEQMRTMIADAAIGCISDIRGRGVLLGLQLDESRPAKDVMLTCLDRGLIVCIAKQNVVRLAPPMTIDEAQLARGMDILIDVLKG